MEIGASLAQLELTAGEPRALAAFYAATFRLAAVPEGDRIACAAPGRQLVFGPGQAGQLRRATFRFHDDAAFDAHQARVRARGIEPAESRQDRYAVRDPLGHLVSFVRPGAGGHAATSPHDARLQHFALRTPHPQALADFYVDQLGFVVSDRVLDVDGDLTAIFLRTDAEHHALALFRAPAVRFDHFSCEVPDWRDLRDWADHMATVGVDLAWGIGRHGPGNDTFFMVRDADGNMGELSSELEVCEPGRPAGTWPHRPQTLNRWGVALMRS
jgi:catechol 2,3-dioxygenase